MKSRVTRSLSLTLLALGALSLAACGKPGIDQVDVSTWAATALPQPSGDGHSGTGRITNRDSQTTSFSAVDAGSYDLTMVCEGNGKIYYTLKAGGQEVSTATNACNGNKDIVRVKLPAGSLDVTLNSVDAPLLYAFSLTKRPA